MGGRKVCFPNSLQAINFPKLQCYCVMVLELSSKNKCGTQTPSQRKQAATLGTCYEEIRHSNFDLSKK